MNAQYDDRATEHKPTEPQQLAREVRRLHATGLTPRDIAAALRLPLPDVLEALARSPE